MLLIPPTDCWGHECDTMPDFHSVFKGILFLHVYVTAEARRASDSHRYSWSYCLMWALRSELCSLQEYQVFLTENPSLWPLICFGFGFSGQGFCVALELILYTRCLPSAGIKGWCHSQPPNSVFKVYCYITKKIISYFPWSMVSKLHQVLIFLRWIVLDAEGPMTDSVSVQGSPRFWLSTYNILKIIKQY